MNKELATQEQSQTVQTSHPTINQETLDNYLYGSKIDLTPEQKVLFYAIAQKNGLDPFKREIYAVKYGDRLNIITGYEVYIKRAQRSGQLDGWETEKIVTGGKTSMRITIYRKDWSRPFKHEVYLDEYKKNTDIWREKPETMLRKVAVSQGFRLAFPEELGGMPYTSEELLGDEIVVEQPKKEDPLIDERKVTMIHSILGYCTDGEEQKMAMKKLLFNKKESVKLVTMSEFEKFVELLEAVVERSLKLGEPQLTKPELKKIKTFWATHYLSDPKEATVEQTVEEGGE